MSLVIVRCDGSPAIGMGHVSRCLALAGELRDVHGCAVTFAMRDEAGKLRPRSSDTLCSPFSSR